MAQRGSTRKRGATWTAYYFVPGPDGQRVQKTRGGFRTQKDARAFLTETLVDVQRGTWSEPRKITVADFLRDEWLPAVRSSKRPSTVASYTTTVEKWIIPTLGGINLPALTAGDIERSLRTLRKSGGKAGGKLSDRSVQYAHTLIKAALAYAHKRGFVQRNAAEGVDRPRSESREMTAWTAEEAAKFIDHTAGDRMAAAWMLFLYRGPRRGELAGLRWQDVDLDAGRVSIRHTRIMVNAEAVTSGPKTKAGIRTVPLDAPLVAALRAHRTRQLEERLAWDGWSDSGYVFVREDGTPPPPEYFSTAFERQVKASGLPVIRLHDCRHTAATLALSAGVPTKVVSEWLGHGNVGITSDLYSHVTPGMMEDAGLSVTRSIESRRKTSA